METIMKTKNTKSWQGVSNRARGVRMMFVALALTITACLRGNELETRTFELEHVRSDDVTGLIEPYVYRDRDGAEGTIGMSERTVTVRELPENLDRIAAVLEQFDRPPPVVRLNFKIIEADGFNGPDPAIAEIEEELRKLFNFGGYRLAAQTALQTLEGSGYVEQTVGDERTYRIVAQVVDVSERGGQPSMTLSIELENLFSTTVSIPLGETVVLGSGQLQEWMTGVAGTSVRAAILVVTPELVEGGQE